MGLDRLEVIGILAGKRLDLVEVALVATHVRNVWVEYRRIGENGIRRRQRSKPIGESGKSLCPGRGSCGGVIKARLSGVQFVGIARKLVGLLAKRARLLLRAVIRITERLRAVVSGLCLVVCSSRLVEGSAGIGCLLGGIVGTRSRIGIGTGCRLGSLRVVLELRLSGRERVVCLLDPVDRSVTARLGCVIGLELLAVVGLGYLVCSVGLV